ncbi:hypothetical protein BHM03_00033915 [Ensete ventricosum]|nr:hypothetical protein BHM03_00033915 [Ensete ventricosum]
MEEKDREGIVGIREGGIAVSWEGSKRGEGEGAIEYRRWVVLGWVVVGWKGKRKKRGLSGFKRRERGAIKEKEVVVKLVMREGEEGGEDVGGGGKGGQDADSAGRGEHCGEENIGAMVKGGKMLVGRGMSLTNGNYGEKWAEEKEG